VGPHEDRPGRDPVGVGHHLAHAGAGIADRAPDTGALDHLALVLRIGAVLRTLEIVEILPTRLGAAERLPIEIDVKPLGGEEAFLKCDEIIKPHAFWSDRHRSQAAGHGDSSRSSLVEVLSSVSLRLLSRISAWRSLTRSAPRAALRDRCWSKDSCSHLDLHGTSEDHRLRDLR